MIHLALFEPEIPPNTGNIIRLCANTGIGLHLIEPLGFDWNDKRLRRAGLDYAEFAHVKRYKDWQFFRDQHPEKRILALTTKGKKCYFDISFPEITQAQEAMILLGPETRGLPQHLLSELGNKNCFKIPMAKESRSLNLSNTAAICVYEAWRQYNFKQF